MCSSDNTLQFGVEAERGLMMFMHHSSVLSSQDTLKVHSLTQARRDTTIQYSAEAIVLSVRTDTQLLMSCFVL